MYRIYHTLRIFSRRALLLATAGLLLGLALPGNVYALDAKQKGIFNDQIKYFNYYQADFCGADINVGAGNVVSTSEVEEANAKIVIGIAKTYNLGREGALIGLITALAESHLKIYANTGIPLSLNHPNKQATGNDHDSLGIFQQRLSTGWSVIDPAKDQKGAVWQLMDPAYSAQAFFGSPPGSNAPRAISKGLQNVDNWRSLNPWIAAQKVQISAFDDGSNYRKQMDAGTQLLNKLYDAAPAVALPVSVTGGSATPTFGAQQSCVGAVNGNLFATILSYAWPKYSPPNYLKMKPEYQAAVDAAVARREYVGGGPRPGVDCGGFVTRVFRDSGVDPEYNKYQGATDQQLKYLRDTPQKYEELKGAKKVRSVADLQPGDIAIRDGHTYIYTGKLPGFERNSASASISFNNTSWRTPMSSDAYDFEGYFWFRPIGLSSPLTEKPPAATPQQQ